MLALITVIVTASVVLILGLVALLRADRKDVPDVAKTIGHWLRGGG